MAMGTRQSERPSLEVTSDLPKSPQPFYTPLNALLDFHLFDGFVEDLCARFYASVMVRPSAELGRYFQLLLSRLLRGHRLGARDRLARDRLAARRRFLRSARLGRTAPIIRRCLGRGALIDFETNRVISMPSTICT